METPNPSNATLYQIIPAEVCFSCDVCCRFLEADSPLAPIFTEGEREKVIAAGADPALFRPQADGKSAQIQLKPHTDFYICPFFDPETSHCTIYPIRPLDCQLYPFALMFSKDGGAVVLGVDTLCPFGEEHLETEAFQRHIRDVINYIESEAVTAQITANWHIIGDYQETVKIVHRLRNSDCLIAMLQTN
ncbi:MAG: YkgJ family cysteine cluster protein [Candidatus Poribacteria bacterium]|nr:YkgJ family cysteine cluster protein [Candidatus Poribacteria bacterium]MYK17705.1 YkgJ family cysteine cluster protein [Candidatus Poribacteria bacterium]